MKALTVCNRCDYEWVTTIGDIDISCPACGENEDWEHIFGFSEDELEEMGDGEDD